MKTVRTNQAASGIRLSGVTMVILALSVLSSCTKSDYDKNGSLDGRASIIPMANVYLTSDTKAAVVGTTFPANTSDVFGVTAYAGSTTPADWSAAPYFDNVAVNSGTASALTFATDQYYPANGDKVYFYAYAPTVTALTAGTSSAAPIASYTIDGQQDIMAAQVSTGIAVGAIGTQEQPAFAFTHKLMQLRFKVVKDVSFETGKKVTEVMVKNVKNSTKLDIATGALTFDGAANQNFTLPITAGTNDEITTGGTEMDGCVMSEPVGTGGSVTLKITADGVVYDNIVVTLSGTNNGLAGTSHLVTLTFKRGEVIPTATISDWVDVGGSSVDVGLASTVGDFKDGGVVYWVDPADAKHYKVFSLTEGAGIWSAMETYELGAAGQSDNDGKANVAAMKAYSLANTGNSDATKQTSGVFATDFPAAGFCEAMNKDGVTGWHLPAKDEMIAFSAAYKANETVLAAAITANSGTDMRTNGYYWSSTESSAMTTKAWHLSFSGNGLPLPKSSSFFLRCVKNI